jgi:hypothetical protein
MDKILEHLKERGFDEVLPLEDQVFARVNLQTGHRDILFYCKKCGWHLQSDLTDIGCKHLRLQYPPSDFGYNAAPGEEWESAENGALLDPRYPPILARVIEGEMVVDMYEEVE